MKIKKPYIIAEVGSNHDNNIKKLELFFSEVKKTGADAIKFQLFRKNDFSILNSKQKKEVGKFEIKESTIKEILRLSKIHKIEILFSIFGKESFNIIKKYKQTQIKIASSEINNYELLGLVGLNFKKIFISSGMSELSEVIKAIEILKKFNIKNLNLLHCIADYPTKEIDVNMNLLNFYKKLNISNIGFSDHTLNNVAALVGLGFGAKIFEKHITLNKKDEGPDNFYSLNPVEFKKYVDDIKLGYKSIGKNEKIITKNERKFGRREGIYIKKNVKKGAKIKKNLISFKMPAIGINKIYHESILGLSLRKNKKKNEPIFFEDLI